MCILAVERFVSVCFPSRAKELLTLRKRYFLAIAITSILAIYCVFDQLCTGEMFATSIVLDSAHKQYCPPRKHKKLTEGLIFFIIPSVITSVLYCFVGLRLRKRSANKDRNRDLTVAFILNCVLWIFLWLPIQVERTIEEYTRKHNPVMWRGGVTASTEVSLKMSLLSGTLFMISALVNPLVLIFVIRAFQNPARRIMKKLRLAK